MVADISREEIKKEILNEGFSFLKKIIDAVKNNIALVTLFTTLISFLIGNLIQLAIYLYNVGIYQYFRIPYSLIPNNDAGFFNNVFIGFLFSILPMILGYLCGFDRKRSKPYLIITFSISGVALAIYIYSLIDPSFSAQSPVGFNNIYLKMLVDIPLIMEITIMLVAMCFALLFIRLYDLKQAQESIANHNAYVEETKNMRSLFDALNRNNEIIQREWPDEEYAKEIKNDIKLIKSIDDEITKMEKRNEGDRAKDSLIVKRGTNDIVAIIALSIMIIIICAGVAVFVSGIYCAHTIDPLGIISLENNSTFAILHESESSYYIVQCTAQNDTLSLQTTVFSYVNKEGLFVDYQQYKNIVIQ